MDFLRIFMDICHVWLNKRTILWVPFLGDHVETNLDMSHTYNINSNSMGLSEKIEKRDAT